MAWTLTTTNLTGTQQRYALAAHVTRDTIVQVMTTRLNEAVTYARDTFRSAPQTTPTATAVRTGALRAALGAEVRVEGSRITGALGYLRGDVPGASVHEGWPEGRTSTTIRPTHGQYLTIPLPAALTSTGVPRGRARDFPNTFFARTHRPGSQLILFQRQGTQIVPLFLLVREVRIPARPALRPTLARYIPLIVGDLTRAVTASLKG